MIRTLFFSIVFLFPLIVVAQSCPNLTGPTNGATNVPVDVEISWEAVSDIDGFLISIGTSPGAGDIVNEVFNGTFNSYKPPLGLPESTQIFVTLTLFFYNADNIVCNSQSFTTRDETEIPACSELTYPQDGATNVSVTTDLNWNYAPRATGYKITIGSSLGAADIVDHLNVGNTLSYNHPVDYPYETTLYVQIEPYNENGERLGCAINSFTTVEEVLPPECTYLINPPDGTTGVPLTPLIEWAPAERATAYKLYIGTTPNDNDVLDGGTFTGTSTYVLNFEPNTTYYVRVVPFNDGGEAQGCIQESFSTILGCGPFIDPDTGEEISFIPELNFPETLSICREEVPKRFYSEDIVDGFRWYKTNEHGAEVLVSENDYIDISEAGEYRYEAYNIIEEAGVELECANSKIFTVVFSETPEIEDIKIMYSNNYFTVAVVVSGESDYEFSWNEIDGPYGNDSVFSNLEAGEYSVYVRDKGGCGTVEKSIVLVPPPEGFPPYFSPNGDGINDTWEYRKPEKNPLNIEEIMVFDRFGKLLFTIYNMNSGWDGNFNGRPLPAGGYWYKAMDDEGRVYSGNFSLFR